MSWPPESDAAIARRVAQRQQLVIPKTKHRKRRTMHEQNLQITVASFLRVATIPPARWWFVPNGGNLSKVQRAKFKDMGLTPGVSDLHFAWSDMWLMCSDDDEKTQVPMFGTIEMKRPDGKGSESEEQIQFGADLEACGHKYACCSSLEAVQAALTSWGFPLRPVQL